MKYLTLLSGILFGLVLFTNSSFANPYGDGNYGACQFNDCTISLTTSGSISVNITPVGGSTTCSDNNDSVGVNTDSSTGYSLTLGDNDTNTNLVGASHGSNITSTTGSFGSPSTLSANHWGYRVDGAGGFGSGPTSSGSNTSPLTLGFAGVQSSSNTPDTIVSTNSPADPTQTTNVWYGACSDTTIPADTYSDTVIYTAVVN